MENGKYRGRKDIAERTFKFGVAVIKISSLLPKTPAGFAIASQLVRSGTSVGANVAEAQDGLTKKEFIKSMSIALKEARETRFWLKISVESGLLSKRVVKPVLSESEELVKILVTIVKKSKMKP